MFVYIFISFFNFYCQYHVVQIMITFFEFFCYNFDRYIFFKNQKDI